jgi:hypothetical protein
MLPTALESLDTNESAVNEALPMWRDIARRLPMGYAQTKICNGSIMRDYSHYPNLLSCLIRKGDDFSVILHLFRIYTKILKCYFIALIYIYKMPNCKYYILQFLNAYCVLGSTTLLFCLCSRQSVPPICCSLISKSILNFSVSA